MSFQSPKNCLEKQFSSASYAGTEDFIPVFQSTKNVDIFVWKGKVDKLVASQRDLLSLLLVALEQLIAVLSSK